MIKKLIIILLLTIPFVVAEEITLNQGESIVLSGKFLKLENIGKDKAVVTVGDTSKIISLNKSETINGLTINLIEIQDWGGTDKKAKLSVSVAGLNTTKIARCGDDTCDPSEEKTCCADCGCETGYTCVNDTCLKNECNVNSGCITTELCMEGICEGEPRKCIFKPKTTCESHDDCCPENCYYPDDLNCPETKTGPFQEIGGNEDVSEPITSEPLIEGQEIEEESFFMSIINWFLDLFR